MRHHKHNSQIEKRIGISQETQTELNDAKDDLINRLQDSVLLLQSQLDALQNEKLNWLAFQEYFEKQLARFSQFQTYPQFYYCANTNLSTNTDQNTANTTQTQKEQKDMRDSKENSQHMTIFNFNMLKSAQNKFAGFNDRLKHILLTLSNPNNASVNNVSSVRSKSPSSGFKFPKSPKSPKARSTPQQCFKVEELQEVLMEMSGYYEELQKQQVQEEDRIQKLRKENEGLKSILQQQQKAKKGSGKEKAESGEVKEESWKEQVEIYQLSVELLNSQLEQMKASKVELLQENKNLQSIGKQMQQVHVLQVQSLKEQLKLEEKKVEQLKKASHPQKVVKHPCTINIYEVQDVPLTYAQDIQSLSSNTQDSTQLKTLQDQLTKATRALITFDRRHKELEAEIDKLQQLLRQQVEDSYKQRDALVQKNEERINEQENKIQQKIQENDAYIIQIFELSKKLNAIEQNNKEVDQLSQENEKLKADMKELLNGISKAQQYEDEIRQRKQSSIRKEAAIQNTMKEANKYKDELRLMKMNLDEKAKANSELMEELQKQKLLNEQLTQEVNELSNQLKEKKDYIPPEQPAVKIVNIQKDDFEETKRLFEENREKMIKMKSKLLGLKTNIEKHGEQMGFLRKSSKKTNQELAQEAEYQNSLIIQELMKLIDQINELQRCIDQDYQNHFNKINEKQRQLISQNFQLKQDLKKLAEMEEDMKKKDEDLESTEQQLKIVQIEYREYQDIMRSKFEQLKKDGGNVSATGGKITAEDREMHKQIKEIEKLQGQLQDAKAQINLLKQELSTRQKQNSNVLMTPEMMQQMQQMQMQMQDEGMVRNAARTIVQNSLDVKQSDILQKKINELHEALRSKIVECQKYQTEKKQSEDRFKQEKVEWIKQIEKKDKVFSQLEVKYKKCLEQFEEQQQRIFELEDGQKDGEGNESDSD